MTVSKAYKNVTAKVPLKRPGEYEAETYVAKAQIYAVELKGKRCFIEAKDLNAGMKGKFYSESIPKKGKRNEEQKKVGEAYLKALLWTNKCSKGIHIWYYTPK